jgi:hypothetical protein
VFELQIQHMPHVTRNLHIAAMNPTSASCCCLALGAMLQDKLNHCTTAAAQLHLLKLSKLICCLANIAAAAATAAAAAGKAGVISTTMSLTLRTPGAPSSTLE